MYYIIDRMEENLVTCETPEKKMVTFQRSDFEGEIKEGDYITVLADGTLKVDTEKTKQRREEVRSLMKNLFE